MTIEICVLEDPQILEHVAAALERGVRVRAIVDHGKYDALASERDNLEKYLTSNGGELHLSNPIFPRSFPKIIVVDTSLVVYGSACLDQTTFARYRDFAVVTDDPALVAAMHDLFVNDWVYSVPPGQQAPPFNPTPPIADRDVILCPVNGTERLVSIYQGAQQTLDVYTELLGNLTLESELAAAVNRGVRVRLISPYHVAGGSQEVQQRQQASLTALSIAGVDVHVNGRETVGLPYMHARAAIADGQTGYLGSISLSPDDTTVNREMALVWHQVALLQQLAAQFDSDFERLTHKF